ncbi:hypothetical protein COCCADRAFT_112992, partial [Bipolaris zeicola 26-R-13]
SPPMTKHSQHGILRDKRIAGRVKRRRPVDPRQIDCQISIFSPKKESGCMGWAERKNTRLNTQRHQNLVTTSNTGRNMCKPAPLSRGRWIFL